MNNKTILIPLICLSLAACAATGPAQRDKLTKNEIKSMGVEIVAHRKCIATKVIEYSASGIDFATMLSTAKAGCQGKLVPVVAKLKGFNLSRAARSRYLRAIQRTATTAVTDAVLKASSKINLEKRKAARQTML